MTTATATVIETQRVQLAAAPSDHDRVDDLQRPAIIQRSTTIHNPSPGFSHRHKHSKKLSLNFPILVPASHDTPLPSNGSLSSYGQSPSATSPYRNGTPISGQPIPSPDEILEAADGPDFLTLIAGQERRVMELKEELQKAESNLLSLKKQWATFEAKKKHAELRNKSVKLGPVSPKTAHANSEEDAERVRRREAAREKKIRDLALKEAGMEGSLPNGGKRKVLAGRHTRTLSLLQSHAPTVDNENGSNITKSKHKSKTESTSADQDLEQGRGDVKRLSRPSISRQPTLQELIASSATGAAQLNFGKTYKDLAQASRKSLPPGTDVFIKQGKEVYDGINQGFWTFVEDIRQATVGDEPVNGPPSDHRGAIPRTRSNKKLVVDDARNKQTKKKSKNSDELKGDKDNFWKEFGLETPQAQRQAQQKASREQKSSKEEKHESKSSTDSQCPPSLLADLMDVNEDDEAWDNWPVDSPSAQRHGTNHVVIRSSSEDGEMEEESLVEPLPQKRDNLTASLVGR
ncbi:hypothetical protein LTS08_004616 [Lithohypha guttulata]|nr:hypothetical protein LTS08_004616 [Lithohypha guttulata]